MRFSNIAEQLGRERFVELSGPALAHGGVLLPVGEYGKFAAIRFEYLFRRSKSVRYAGLRLRAKFFFFCSRLDNRESWIPRGTLRGLLDWFGRRQARRSG